MLMVMPPTRWRKSGSSTRVAAAHWHCGPSRTRRRAFQLYLCLQITHMSQPLTCSRTRSQQRLNLYNDRTNERRVRVSTASAHRTALLLHAVRPYVVHAYAYFTLLRIDETTAVCACNVRQGRENGFRTRVKRYPSCKHKTALGHFSAGRCVDTYTWICS